MASLQKRIMDPSEDMALSYNGQPPGSPDYPDLITSGQERRDKGIGRAYVDEYNQMLTNQYNNAYNYWLWQQQMAYNSPSSQMARYLEAGLNPHYQTVEGGNASGLPSSQAQVRGNVRQNQLNAVSNGVSIATSLASLIARGVGAFRQIATTPASIRLYRKLLTGTLKNRIDGQSLSNNLKELNLEGLGVMMGNSPGSMAPGIEDSLWYKTREESYAGLVLQNAIRGKESELLDIKRQLAQFDLDNLRPAELQIMQAKLPQIAAQINYLLAGTGLRIKEGQWKDTKEGWKIVSYFIDSLIPG